MCTSKHEASLQDALPPRVLSQRLRIAVYMALFFFHLIYYCIVKFNAADIYSKWPVPEYSSSNYVQWSSYDVVCKGTLTTTILCAHMVYRAWWYPAQAVLLQKAVPYATLGAVLHGHRSNTLNACICSELTPTQNPMGLQDKFPSGEPK